MKHKSVAQFGLLLVVFAFLCLSIAPLDTNPLWRFPSLISVLPIWINGSVDFMLSEWMPIEFYDADVEEYKTRPLLLQVTRMISAVVLFSIELLREILLGGVELFRTRCRFFVAIQRGR